MYVNCSCAERQGSHFQRVKCSKGAHQRVPSFPSQFLSQELDDGLETIRRCDLVEVLLHDGGISDSLEAYNHCAKYQFISPILLFEVDVSAPFAGSFFLYESSASSACAIFGLSIPSGTVHAAGLGLPTADAIHATNDERRSS